MGINITASKLQLAQECAWPFVQDVEVPPDTGPKELAEEGTRKHDIMAAWINDRVLCEEPWFRMWHEQWPLIEPDRAVAELAFAFDTKTGEVRKLGRDIGREYEARGARPIDICGSVDVIGYAQGNSDMGVVIDHKTGAHKVTPAVDNLQIKFAALCWADLAGLKDCRGEVHYIDPDGLIEVDQCDYSRVVLEQTRETLMNIAAIRDVNPLPQAGPHCDLMYCPARPACPEYRKRAAAIVPADIDIPTLVKTSPSKALDLLAAGRVVMKVLEKASKAEADNRGGALVGENLTLSKSTSKRRSFDTKAVKAALGDRVHEFERTIEVATYRFKKTTTKKEDK